MQPADLPQRVSVGNKTVTIQWRLGNGNFGVVYKVKDEASSKVYALKDILCSNASALRNAVREATTLNKISHQNVIAVMGADQFQDSKGLHMLILTEYCSGGSLNDRLARPSSEEMNMKWFCQTAAALAHLHSHGVVHRDLKADNVLLTATEDLKLADFGLAREYTALKRIDVKQDEGSWLTSYTQYYMNSGVGPIHWVAPEFFAGRYTEKADVFSLGTLFYAILERDFIVIDGKAIYGAFVNIRGVGKVGLGYAMAHSNPRHSIIFSSGVQESKALQRVILEALQYDRNDRPSAEDMYRKVLSIQAVRLLQRNIQLSPQQQFSTTQLSFQQQQSPQQFPVPQQQLPEQFLVQQQQSSQEFPVQQQQLSQQFLVQQQQWLQQFPVPQQQWLQQFPVQQQQSPQQFLVQQQQSPQQFLVQQQQSPQQFLIQQQQSPNSFGSNNSSHPNSS